MILLIPVAWYVSGKILSNQQPWVNILAFAGILLVSVPKDLSLALFEQTGVSVFLSPILLADFSCI